MFQRTGIGITVWYTATKSLTRTVSRVLGSGINQSNIGSFLRSASRWLNMTFGAVWAYVEGRTCRRMGLRSGFH